MFAIREISSKSAPVCLSDGPPISGREAIGT